MPIYLSKFQDKETMIRASTIAGARNHVLKPLVPDIKQLDAEGVADAMGRGLMIENAGEVAIADTSDVTDATETEDAK